MQGQATRIKRTASKRKPEKLTVAEYLLKKLASCGIRHLFSLPHEYLLRLNHYIMQDPKICYVEASSGQLAANMADGYAKASGFAACAMASDTAGFVETIARAHAEQVPLVIILGLEAYTPNSLHHGIEYIERGLRELTAAWTVLDDIKLAAKKIDRSIDAARHFKQPVCIELPQEMADLILPPHQPAKTEFGELSIQKKARSKSKPLNSKLIGLIDRAIEKLDCAVVTSQRIYPHAKSLQHTTRTISTNMFITPGYAMEAAIGTCLAKQDEHLIVLLTEQELQSSFEALSMLQRLANHVILCVFSDKSRIQELFEAENYSWSLTELAHLFVDGNAIQVHTHKAFENTLEQALEMPSGLFLIECDLDL